jgi:hypothetical protein
MSEEMSSLSSDESPGLLPQGGAVVLSAAEQALLRKLREHLYTAEAAAWRTGEKAEAKLAWEQGNLINRLLALSPSPLLECAVHQGVVHGGEAEALRSGVELLIEIGGASVSVADLQSLLDRVEACDSLGHLERIDLAAGIGAILADDSLPSGAVLAKLRRLVDDVS